MNTPWEREVSRALRLANAVLHPAPALPWAAPARALAADPAARFDALLAGLLQLPDAPPSAPPAEDVLPRAASPFASAPERRDGGWGFPPSAGSPAVHAGDPAPPPSPLFRVPLSRLFAEDAPRPAASVDDPRPAGFDPPSALGGFAPPRVETPWTGLEGWTSAPPPSSAFPPSSTADAWREVDGWTPAPPSSPPFPSFAWDDVQAGDAAPSTWDADPPRGALPDAERAIESDPQTFPGVRVARSTADLRALLEAHVASPDLEAPPAFPPFDPAPPAERLPLAEAHPAETAFPAPRPDTAGDRLLPPSAGGVPAVATPDAGGAAYFPAFPGAETGPSALAEELLLERLMDRMEERAREDSIRRFGLTGGA